jgi:hypothetical protein
MDLDEHTLGLCLATILAVGMAGCLLSCGSSESAAMNGG